MVSDASSTDHRPFPRHVMLNGSKAREPDMLLCSLPPLHFANKHHNSHSSSSCSSHFQPVSSSLLSFCFHLANLLSNIEEYPLTCVIYDIRSLASFLLSLPQLGFLSSVSFHIIPSLDSVLVSLPLFCIRHLSHFSPSPTHRVTNVVWSTNLSFIFLPFVFFLDLTSYFSSPFSPLFLMTDPSVHQSWAVFNWRGEEVRRRFHSVIMLDAHQLD